MNTFISRQQAAKLFGVNVRHIKERLQGCREIKIRRKFFYVRADVEKLLMVRPG